MSIKFFTNKSPLESNLVIALRFDKGSWNHLIPTTFLYFFLELLNKVLLPLMVSSWQRS